MPLAIPVLIDFEEEITWVDIEEAYYASRVLRLFGVLDSRIADLFRTSIDHFNIEDEEERIQLWIHCRKRRVNEAVVNLYDSINPSVVNLYDTMQESAAPLQTFCIGKSAGAATLLLMGGKKGVRVGFPYSKIGIHFPETQQGRKRKVPLPSIRVSSDLEYDAAIRERITRLYALKTGNPFSVIYTDMEKGRWMTAEQAKAYGIIDRIGLGKQ